MFEREKLITNFSLTLLSVANKFDIVVWKSNEYIHLVKLNVINLTCTESDQTLVCSGIQNLCLVGQVWIASLLLIFYQYNLELFQSKPLCSIFFQRVVYFCWVQWSIHSMFMQIPHCRKVWEEIKWRNLKHSTCGVDVGLLARMMDFGSKGWGYSSRGRNCIVSYLLAALSANTQPSLRTFLNQQLIIHGRNG